MMIALDSKTLRARDAAQADPSFQPRQEVADLPLQTRRQIDIHVAGRRHCAQVNREGEEDKPAPEP